MYHGITFGFYTIIPTYYKKTKLVFSKPMYAARLGYLEKFYSLNVFSWLSEKSTVPHAKFFPGSALVKF